MGFSSTGKLVGADDVATSTLQAGQYLEYNSDTTWRNVSLAGKVALANQGGAENVSTLNSTATTTLNLANGNVFNVTLVGNTTFAFTGATAGKACSFTLYIKQDGTGNRTVTWPASRRWAGGTAPVLSTAANSVDIVVFESIDGGTTWYGSLVGTNFS